MRLDAQRESPVPKGRRPCSLGQRQAHQHEPTAAFQHELSPEPPCAPLGLLCGFLCSRKRQFERGYLRSQCLFRSAVVRDSGDLSRLETSCPCWRVEATVSADAPTGPGMVVFAKLYALRRGFHVWLNGNTK